MLAVPPASGDTAPTCDGHWRVYPSNVVRHRDVLTGVAVLKALASGASASAGALPSVSQLFGKMVPGAAGATGAQVPFSLRGTLDDPKFSLAGTPQFIRSQTTQPPPDQPQPPSLQDLFKLFH